MRVIKKVYFLNMIIIINMYIKINNATTSLANNKKQCTKKLTSLKRFLIQDTRKWHLW